MHDVIVLFMIAIGVGVLQHSVHGESNESHTIALKTRSAGMFNKETDFFVFC